MTIADQNYNFQNMKDHLFISYATEDGDFAEWLTLRLTAEGYKIWCDRVKLLGGESYPKDIDKAIKEQTFRMLAIMSKNSLTKPNPVKERILGHNISRQRKVDFIIPLMVDDTQPDELDWMSSDITFIPFKDSWAQGLLQLIKKFNSIDTPRPLSNGTYLVSEWVTNQSSLKETEETLWTNLFEIKSMPLSLYKITVSEDFKFPDRPWVFYKQSNEIFWSFELPDSAQKYLSVEWNDGRRNIHGIAPIDVTASLIKDHITRVCREKKAWINPGGDLFLSREAVPNGWLHFNYYNGKHTKILAYGERTVVSTGGTRKHYRYYLSPIFRPILRKYTIPVVELQTRLYIADMEDKPLEPKLANSRRKKIAKNWWNYEWMLRVFAIGGWLFEGKPECNLAAGYGYDIIVAGTPLPVIAPLGINEISLSQTEEVEEHQGFVEDDDLDEIEWSDV